MCRPQKPCFPHPKGVSKKPSLGSEDVSGEVAGGKCCGCDMMPGALTVPLQLCVDEFMMVVPSAIKSLLGNSPGQRCALTIHVLLLYRLGCEGHCRPGGGQQ